MQWNVFLFIFNSKYRFFICVINSVLLFRFKNRLLQQMNGLMWIQKIDTKPHATGKPQMTSDQQINIILHMYAVAVLKLLFFFDNRDTRKKNSFLFSFCVILAIAARPIAKSNAKGY